MQIAHTSRRPRLPWLLLAMIATSAPAGADCFTLIAGRAATADGCVLFAHNEDNELDDPAGLVQAERLAHAPAEWVVFPSGARIPQADTTWAWWALRMPGLDYSDAYVNEHGVAVVSNNCPSREDAPELIDGGLGGPLLRRLVAERARTARAGVRLVGALIERFGYTASGRTLAICDAREGWLVAMVNGRHWVAVRVPDDQVAAIANTYTIRGIDPADTTTCLACPDLIDYAVARGWHDPARPFDFAAAYADPGAAQSPDNTLRQWSGLARLAAVEPAPPTLQPLPFAVTPRAPLRAADLMAVLRDHYEHGAPGVTPATGPDASPHRGAVSTICRPNTNSASVFELRADHAPLTAVVWWIALWQPCTSPFVPFYPATRVLPDALALPAVADDAAVPVPLPLAYSAFSELSRWAEGDHHRRAPELRDRWHDFEQRAFANQPELERQSDPAALAARSRALLLEAADAARAATKPR